MMESVPEPWPTGLQPLQGSETAGIVTRSLPLPVLTSLLSRSQDTSQESLAQDILINLIRRPCCFLPRKLSCNEFGPAAIIFFRCFSFSQISVIAARATAHPTDRPAWTRLQSSLPTRQCGLAITGAPHAIASRGGRPKPSYSDG